MGCKSVNQDPGDSSSQRVFLLCLPLLVFPLAKAPLKAWGSPQITAERSDTNAEGSGDGDCRERRSPASARLTLGLGMVGITRASSLGNIHPQPHCRMNLLFPRV